MRLVGAAAAIALTLLGCTASAAPAPAPISPAGTADVRITAANWLQPGAPPLGIISFTEIGLTAGRAVTIVASADSLSGFDCLDSQGRLLGRSIPLTSQVSALRTFTADAGGTLRGALLLSPPPPSGIGCPGTSRPYATTALYTNGLIADVSNRIDQHVPGQSGRPPGVADR